MKKVLKALYSSRLTDQSGVTIILVAILMFVFLGIAALAVDLSNLYVVRNELQNAADAGALAGARFLYAGTSVNEGANQIAYDTATANKALALTGAIAVDVNWPEGTDVQRGHWSFGLGGLPRGFYPNSSTAPVDLWDRSTEELDADTNFINAVRMVARRQATPSASFFAQIFGYENFELWKEAVAYIGFAGSLRPEDVDQPIAICKQSIIDEEGHYTCATGRMIDSGGGTTHNTAAWTNFTQDPCQTASAQSVRPLVCGDGNPAVIDFGDGMGTTGGMQDNVYNDLKDCWLNAPLQKDWRGYPIEFWGLTLPVIDCPGNNPGPCSDVVGAVTLDVIWIKQSGSDPQWRDIPVKMAGWECSIWVTVGRPENINSLDSSQRQQCWQEFATTFELRTADGTSVGDLTHSDLQKTILFLPSCEPHEPRGNTGGENFGVLALIPVLVK
jgi:hypothetical protein